MTQKENVYYHLKHYGPLSPLEALNKYGSLRLGAIIFDLKKDGVDIESKIVKRGKKHFAEYRLRTITEPSGQMRLV